MKFLLSVLLTMVLAYLAGLVLPWWSIAIVSFGVALLIPQSPGKSFLSGFLGIFILWILLASWIDVNNDSILSHRMAQVFPLGGSSFLIILISGIIGGLVGGFAALAGSGIKWQKTAQLKRMR